MEKYPTDRIVKEFDNLEIKKSTRERLMPYLERLRSYHEPTFEHSVRVANLSKQIAEFTHNIEPKTPWLSGLVHDFGKLKIQKGLLEKRSGWNGKDAESMRKHIEFGCSILLGLANFSAFTTFYSHYFKKENSYPTDEDFTKIFGTTYKDWSKASRLKGMYCGRLVALADVYDAITTRENEKFSPNNPRLLSSEEAETIFLETNPDQSFLIKQLYSAGIFKK